MNYHQINVSQLTCLLDYKMQKCSSEKHLLLGLSTWGSNPKPPLSLFLFSVCSWCLKSLSFGSLHSPLKQLWKKTASSDCTFSSLIYATQPVLPFRSSQTKPPNSVKIQEVLVLQSETNVTLIMQAIQASLVAQMVKNLPAMWETWV